MNASRPLAADGLIATGHALDVRDADPRQDSIDGVAARLVVEPRTPEAVAAALAWASEQKLSVLIEGAATKRAWGSPPDRLDVVLSLRKLNRVIAHRHGDLTVTAEAGLSIEELNRALSEHRQHLPLDPPSGDRATIGGLLATNDSGPMRHRYGTPRDLVIGVRLATIDGRLVKAGGQVVKNVAGYDLSRLVCGSFGTLAAIVSATFKLAPLPAASSTLVVDAAPATLTRLTERIAATQLEPLAFELRARRTPSGEGAITRCLIRFASVAAAVDAQLQEARAHVSASESIEATVTGEEEARLWRAHAFDPNRNDAIVRVSWLPADAAGVLALLEHVGSSIDAELVGRAGIGAGFIRLTGEVRLQAAAIEQLRQSKTVGNVVVTSAPLELKSLVDIWGPCQNRELLHAVKRAVDPNGTLGAGRLPV